MSWFSSNDYSQAQKYITEAQVRRLCTWVGSSNLSQSDSQVAAEAILKRRGSDGHMSLYQIYDTLTELKDNGQISKFDRETLVERFEEFFNG